MMYLMFLANYIVILLQMLIISQITVVKFLQVFTFSHFSTINEYFAAQLCFNVNVLSSVLLGASTLFTNVPDCHHEIGFFIGIELPCDQTMFDNVSFV